MRKNTAFSRFIHSLRFRLMILVIAIALIPGLVIRLGVLTAYENRAVSIRTSEVQSQATILANQIAAGEYMSSGSLSSTSTIQSEITMLTTIYEGRVMLVNQAYRIIYDSYNLDTRRTIIVEEVIKSFEGTLMTHYDSENHYIEMTVPIVNPDDETGTVQGVMLVSVSTNNIELNRTYLNRYAIIIELITSAVVLFFGMLYVYISIRPFQKLSADIDKVQGGYGDGELKVTNYTETAQISEKINDMLGRMKVMDESRQEFVANVSHELKTPMTSMKVLADSIISMPDAPKELYQEFMEDITNEVERETKVINDLLSLVKMDKSGATLNIEEVHINDMVEQILKRLQPIADRQKVEIVLESFRPVVAEVDEVKLSLAITNLVENGIKYNRADGTGWVHVTLNSDHQYFYVKVEDNGCGIPEDSMDQIYERFYRVDKSHSREIGGTGLGLAITRSAVLMHHGAIKAHSILGEGTTFDVRIPLTYIL
ncbi:MAG: cell wall metabolism sensor histidine kinase WalK [Clostridiales bacterium]|nr:cell wall metabolism sensor histidine kinase WalK [Clostridiales bacterium]